MKSRMLDSVYPIVWMDAIHYKVTDERSCAVPVQSIICWELIGMGIKNFIVCIYIKMMLLTSDLVPLHIFRIEE